MAPLIHGPTSNSALARYASSRQNLRDFVDRILTVYLGDLGKNWIDLVSAAHLEIFYLARGVDNTDSTTPITVPLTPAEDRLRDKIAVITVGILTMCAYAYFSGLIRVEISQVE